MTVKLPYLHSPGSIKNALDRIRSAATPERVTNDFITTVLQIKGGTGKSLSPYLKRIGFVATDGAATDLYKKFRNPAYSGFAVADAIKIGYRELLQANEYFYKLTDKDLKSLILQVTGLATNDRVAGLIHSTLVQLRSYADFEGIVESETIEPPQKLKLDPSPMPPAAIQQSGRVGLNLSYTINLNLPATSDQAVFNAIFRSLKEHLLSSNE